MALPVQLGSLPNTHTQQEQKQRWQILCRKALECRIIRLLDQDQKKMFSQVPTVACVLTAFGLSYCQCVVYQVSVPGAGCIVQGSAVIRLYAPAAPGPCASPT